MARSQTRIRYCGGRICVTAAAFTILMRAAGGADEAHPGRGSGSVARSCEAATHEAGGSPSPALRRADAARATALADAYTRLNSTPPGPIIGRTQRFFRVLEGDGQI